MTSGKPTSQRVTDTDIVARVVRMQKAGMPVDIDGAFGQYKVTTRGGSRNLSPRLTNRAIMEWLEAYECGWLGKEEHGG